MEGLIQNMTLWIFPFFISITWHEVAHAQMAHLRGDKTAKDSNRLKWNPFYHLDGIGSVVIPSLMLLLKSGVLYGWGRSLPVNIYALKKPLIDRPLVALSGFFMNVILAFAFSLLLKLGHHVEDMQMQQLGYVISQIASNGISINVIIFMVNLIPIPPLDGGRFLECFVSKRTKHYLSYFEPIGLILIVSLLFFPDTKKLIIPIHNHTQEWVIRSTDQIIQYGERKINKLWQLSPMAPASQKENKAPEVRQAADIVQ
ncbi:site-2 protease family protein [Gammaproteobacteria bacterium]|nr:site-2 protease family protein [Gammaproteobacteria bacterium]